MSVRRLCLAILAIAALVQFRVHATTYYAPLHPTGVVNHADTVRSGCNCVELRFYPDYTFLQLWWTGPGETYLIWSSIFDEEWQGRGRGTHSNHAAVPGTAEAVMQGDGNFVIYDQNSMAPLWSTGTAGNSGAYLNVQSDMNMVVYTASGAPLWSLF
jgi:hypothetical protein